MLRSVQEALRRAQQKQSLTSKTEPSPKKPRVVCGMTLIPGDPTIDPAMVHPVPKKDHLKFTLQTVVPPACQR